MVVRLVAELIIERVSSGILLSWKKKYGILVLRQKNGVIQQKNFFKSFMHNNKNIGTSISNSHHNTCFRFIRLVSLFYRLKHTYFCMFKLQPLIYKQAM